MPSRSRARLSSSVLLALTAALGASGATLVSPSADAASAGTSKAAVRDDGPHAPQNRVSAALNVTHRDGVAVSRYDFGDVEVGARPGQFRAPVRGSLITPDGGSRASKFVIISHLRSPGCADRVYAFPCPGQDVRLDRGMEYLGVALAKRGYTVLIPDLAPVWIAATPTGAYDQTKAWLRVVGSARDALGSDVRGTTHRFGLDLKGRVDLSGVGLVVHSRSGYVAGAVATAWARTTTPVRSILAYGPAYDVPDAAGRISPPVPANVPYLAVVGDADQDVPFNAEMWLSQHVEQKRRAAAVVATVPGLGHDAINETLSNAHVDDRLDCTPATCPSPSTHRAVLTSVAENYFGATLQGRATDLPLAPDAVLPRRIGGLPARILAVTNAADRLTLFDADTSTAPRTSRGSHATLCRFYPPDDPARHPDACALPDLGTDMLVSRVARVRLTPGGSFSLPTRLTNATSVDLQVTPYGDRADKTADSPLHVTLTTAAGRRVAPTMPADAPDVTGNRSTADANGTYVLGTLRIPVPAALRDQVITSVEVSAPRGGDYALRAVEVRGRAVAGGTTTPTKPAPGPHPTVTATPSTPKPTSPGAHGPLVNTDRALDARDGDSHGAAGLTALALLGTGVAAGLDRKGRRAQRSR